MTKSRQVYPTDLNDTQWSVLAPYFSKEQKSGRPREHAWCEILDAFFYERLPETSEAFVDVTMIRLMTRRLAHV